MASTRRVSGILLVGLLAAVPGWAEAAQHRRQAPERQRDAQTARQAPPVRRDRAVPRSSNADRRNDVRRSDNTYDRSRLFYRPGYGYAYRGRTVIVPRVIAPRIVAVVPYRPYIYRPSLSLGVFYGSDGLYPYGYVPRGYYDPIPGHVYGGLRITGAPRDAQVFADGYYVGIVNDFDGVFQHLNLEPGPHHIEVAEPGFEPIAFDVDIRSGQTITFRADMYQD
jgi:hypothetical protein